MNLENLMMNISYVMVYFVFVYILKVVLDKFTNNYYNADSQMKNNNIAIGLRRSGLYLGFGIGFIGALSGQASTVFIDDILNTVLYGTLITIMMLTALYSTERFILPCIDNTKALKDGNISVGVIEFSILIMTGIIAFTTVKNEGLGFIATILYFIASQALIVGFINVYERFYKFKYNVDTLEKIRYGNTSVGLHLGGKLIGYGFIVFGVLNTYTIGSGAISLATNFIIVSFIGMTLLYVFEKLIDFIMLRDITVKEILIDDRYVLALQLTSVKIAMAMIIGTSIL